MNGFIGTLAAQLALQPVSPAADGIASRPRRPVAECPRAPGGPHVNAPPHPADGARRCPSRAPGRRRASMSRLLHRGGAHRRSWAPPHPAGGLGRGMAGTSMLPLAQPRGGFAGDMLPCPTARWRTAAAYRRRVFKMSWLWQDMRAMHPKSPANRRWRIHRAKILPGRSPFRCTNPSNHARRAPLAFRVQGLAHGRQEELGIASALRIAADGPAP